MYIFPSKSGDLSAQDTNHSPVLGRNATQEVVVQSVDFISFSNGWR